MNLIKSLSEKLTRAVNNDWVVPKSGREKFLDRFYLFLLFVLCFIKLEPYIIPQLDDMTHAAMGISILQTGDWFTMHEGKMISWLKPPLYFWIEAVLFKIFEPGEYWAKFPAALTGFLTFLFSYKTACKLFNRKVGFLTLFVLSTSLFFLRYTQRVMLDMPVAFAVTLGVFAVVEAQISKNKNYYFLFGLAAALGYYFKGMQGLYLFGIIPLYFVFTGQIKEIFSSRFLLSVLTAFTLIGLWFIPQYLTHGREFLLSQSGIGPLIYGGLPGYENPFYNPFKNLLRMFYWILVSVYGMWIGIKELKNPVRKNSFIMLFSWFWTIMAALSISSVFGVRYFIPALVPAGMFAAIGLEKVIKGKNFDYFHHAAVFFAAAILTIIAVFPMPPAKKGSKYISLYRCVNHIVDKKDKIILYKDRQYIFNQGLVFYSRRPLDKQVRDLKELKEEIKNTDKKIFIISTPQDYGEIEQYFSKEKILKVASSGNWILFQIKDGY